MTTYYIDSENGDDNDTGTSELRPWKTLTKASPVARGFYVGGDIIRPKYGSRWFDQLLLGEQGDNLADLLIEPYGNPAAGRPIIEGNGSAQNLTLPSFFDAILLRNVGRIVIRGLELRYTSFGIRHFTSSDTYLGVGGRIWPNFLADDLYIHDIVGDVMSLGGSEDATETVTTTGTHRITNSRLRRSNNDGIALLGKTPVEVDRCWISEIGVDVPFVDASSGDGITGHGTASGHNFHHNIIEKCRDGIHNINAGVTTPNKIHANFIRDCVWTLINLDDIQVNGNFGEYQIYNNILASRAGLDLLAMIQLGNNPLGNDSWVAKIRNNTIINRSLAAYAIWARGRNGGANTLDLRNNVFGGARHVNLNRNGNAGATLTLDRNRYERDAADAFVFDGVQKTFAGWKTSTGADANSTVGELGLVGEPHEAGTKAAELRGASACRLGTAAGVNFTADFTTDFFDDARPGAGAWDLGAAVAGPYRYGGSALLGHQLRELFGIEED